MDGYWQSPDGQRHRYRVRSQRRALVSVSQEPTGKGGDVGAQVAFRREVRRQLDALKLRPHPRATLAVDLRFRTTARQPPHVHTLAKHYLDLLGSTHAPAADPGPVLFNDDGQVGLLHVFAHHDDDASQGHRRIDITATTRADVLDDLRLAGDLLVDHEDLLDDTFWDDGDVDQLVARDDGAVLAWQEAQDDPAARQVVAWLRWWDAYRAQERVLRATDRWLRHRFLTFGHHLLVGKDPMGDRLQAALGGSSEVWHSWAELSAWAAQDLLNPLLTVHLPPLPTRSGQGRSYREGIAGAFAEAVRTHPLYRRLLVPVRATIIVAPPARPSKAKGRDYDSTQRVGSHSS